MRYRLRTLMVLLALGPPVLAPLGAWGLREYQAYRERQQWIEMTMPHLDRNALIKSMLCPSHPPDSEDSAPPASNYDTTR
jgi:hypothetical protein